jgi:WD40 repeat protein
MRYTISVVFSVWLCSLIILAPTPLSAQTQDILWQTQIATTAVTSVLFSPDGQYVAARASNTVYILSSNSGQILGTLVLPTSTDEERFLNYTFSPDGNYVYLAFLACSAVHFCDGIIIKKWSITLAEYIHSYIIYGPHDGSAAQDIFTSG